MHVSDIPSYLGFMRVLEICRIPSGRADVRQGEYGSRLPFHLQGAQGVTVICLVAEAIAASNCLRLSVPLP
jgi:hypothetical protein